MGVAWTSGLYMSVARINAASNHQMTGEEIEDLPTYLASPGMKVFCTEDSPSGTYKKDKTYSMRSDLSGWDVEGLAIHNHTDLETGGVFSETLVANIPTTIDYDKRFAKVDQFYTSVANGGSVTDDNTNTRMVLDSSDTNTGRASIYDGGARQLDFAHSSSFEATLLQNSSSSFKTKVGLNAESIEVANNPLKPSYGIEGCSSSGTVWLVWSSDGSTRSTVPTAAPIVTATPTVPDIYLLDHQASNSITLLINGAFIVEKVTDVPTSGLTDLNNLYRAGIQNATAAQKILYHYGGPRIVGMT